MKGKAQLILTDPDSGRVVKRVEESNMVTNAIQRIFDIPKQAILRGNSSEMYNGFMPIYKYLMSGLVMLGNNIDENPDKFMIPEDSVFVGLAGSTYTGTAPARGTMNQSQSGEIDNGYRFVWDFAPEKAIGTIRCIGLTSLWFGNAAFTREKQDGSILMNPIIMGTPDSTARVEYFYTKGTILGYPDGGQILYSMYVSRDKTTIYRYRVPDYNALRINEAISDFRNMEIVRKDEYTLPFIVTDYRCCAYDKANKWEYYFNISYNSSAKIENVKFCALDIRTGEIKRDGSFSWTPKSHTSTVYFGIHQNKIYVSENGDMRAFNTNGEQVEAYDFGNVAGVIPNFSYSSKSALVIDNATSSCFYTYFKHDPMVYIRTPNILQSADYMSLPYVMVYNISNSDTNVAQIMLRSDYLATINNLAEPLVKTDRHALQVRYEITNN